MPLIVEYSYADGSKERMSYPVQIWRKNDALVRKVLATNKELIGIEVDPDAETADIDTSNNFWPQDTVESEFDCLNQRLKDNLKTSLESFSGVFFLVYLKKEMQLFISGAEIVFIFFVVLLVFGADRIPSIARGLAKG